MNSAFKTLWLGSGISLLIGTLTFAKELPAKSGTQSSSLTDVQFRLLGKDKPTSAEVSDLIQKYKLTRIWPMNSEKDLLEDQVVGKAILNKASYVAPLTCGGESFAQFRSRGVIRSDESTLIDDLLTQIKPSTTELQLFRLNKAWQKAAELYPNFIPSSRNRQDGTQGENKLSSQLLSDNQKNIQLTTSLIEVKKDSQGKAFLNNTDYTVGGWFKPDWSEKSVANPSGFMRLLSKKFMGDNGNSQVEEWTLSIAGNIVYFHNFRDGQKTVHSHYLTLDQADQFRNQHADQFSPSDYYEDVVARNEVGFEPTVSPYLLPPIVPGEKGEVTKPVPVPPGPPMPPPHHPRPVPFPPYPAGDFLIGGIGQVGKEYTIGFDLKRFWWATSIGTCYECMRPNTHTDVWHYIAVSVHLNDPLGPYVDFWILQDPNPRMFGHRPTFEKNLAHSRWELPRGQASFPILNPLQNSDKVERDCAELRGSNPHETCVKSVFEIGSNDPNNGFSGFMRGIYLAKSALKEKDILDLASRYYPNDKIGCTYKSLPDFMQPR